MFSDRKERLRTVARLAKENGINPDMNTFAGFVIKVVCTNFGLTRATANQDLDSLVIAWTDKWKTLLNDEEVIVEEDAQPKTRPLPELEKPSDVRAFLASWKPKCEPVKRVERKTEVSYNQPWTRNEIAVILYSKARNDMFDGVGRVLLSEARELADNKLLSFEEMVNIFQRKYPTINVSRASGNIMLVYFNGREALKIYRKVNAKVQPMAPELMGENEYKNPEEVVADKDEYKSPED